MYNIYTYEIDRDLFFDNLIGFLKSSKTKEEESILELINGAKCFIKPLVPNRPIKPIPPKMPSI